MYHETESRRFKYWVFAFLIFATCGWLSYQEMKYLIWGRTAEAQITTIRTVTIPRHRFHPSKDMFAVRYRWTDADDVVREDVMNRNLNWKQPADNIIRIEYLPGSKASRMEGERDYIALLIFITIGGLLTFVTIKTWRRAYRK
ncbi:MAG: hypothetical protein MI923_10865 [Phycisphaerales bacterium]|nr:hypothetical protein [Phycisphaerales bacterium]